MADWPATNVVVVPEQEPVGVASDWQVIVPSEPATDGAIWVSFTPTEVKLVFPVLVTTNVYVTVWPEADTTVGLAVLTILIPVVGILSGDEGEVMDGPLGGVPVAVAESATAVAAKSAAVTV